MRLSSSSSPDGLIVDVSPAYLGSVHDKTLWDREASRLQHLFDSLVLADKAYAGAAGELRPGQKGVLARPVKRGGNAWKEDPERAKAFNRELSRRRVRIEHVFARLKTWRVIDGLVKYRWPRLTVLVRALAVVHNANRQVSLAA